MDSDSRHSPADSPCHRSLPPSWIEALDAIDSAARRASIPYSIVGSLGVAVALDTRWDPVRPGVVSGWRRQRDLDVFLSGGSGARLAFRAMLDPALARPAPLIDVVSWYHEFTEFGPHGASLRYRAVRVPVDARLFAPVRIPWAGLPIPVLHPRVHMHLIEMLPRASPKGMDRVQALSAGLAAGLDRFPALSEADCSPFRAFKEERRQRYPRRERVLAFRMRLWEWEEEGRHTPLVSLKAHVRARYPRVAQAMRKLFG